MSSYERIGTLMRETIQAYRGCDPQAMLNGLKREGGRWLLNKARNAQMSLYGMVSDKPYPQKDAFLANFWSEVKYEMLIPNYVLKADKGVRMELRMHLKNEEKLIRDTLKEANMGYDWNPDRQTEFSEESATEEQ